MSTMAVAPTRTDAGLVRRLQARDRAAWEELYAEYQPRLRAFGYRLAGNAHDADDLAQETFVRALPALDRLDPDRVDLAAYLFATEKNLFLKQVERAKRAEPTADVPEPELPTAIGDDPERSALLHRQQEEVRIANARLDPRQRLVLALCELEDRSYAEIGELVGLNENAVAQLVFRARERLRTELRLVQVDPESLPEECRAFLPLLAQHLDGKLRGPRLETTLAHLEDCARCQAALADMREAKRRYRALLLPPLGMSEEQARAATEQELDRVGYWRGPSRFARLRRPRGATAVAVAVGAAVLLVSGVGTTTLLGRTSREATSTSAEVMTIPRATNTTRATVPAPPPRATATTAKAAPTSTKPVEATKTTQTTSPSSPAQAPPTDPAPTVEAPPTTETVPTTKTPRRRPKRPAQVVPLDTTAPTVRFTAGPPATTADTSTTFAFAATEASSLACRLDAGAWQRCTSPHALAALVIGAHTLAVRATDKAGNAGPPAERTWTVTPPPDTIAPTVTFTTTPPGSSTSRSAQFEFAASEPSVTFACSYDGEPYLACTSPFALDDVGADDHSLAVRATDAVGNTGPPAVARWTVVAPLPDLVAVLTDTSVTVRNTGVGSAGASLVDIPGIGIFTIPALGPGQSSAHTYRCKSGTITAAADSTKLVTESDEANNTATRVVTCLGFGT
jgi:RNA polymerase sigma factor (sigma-70 family)